MLNKDPSKRPTIDEIMQVPFIKARHIQLASIHVSGRASRVERAPTHTPPLPYTDARPNRQERP
jgi:hypothetical protein